MAKGRVAEILLAALAAVIAFTAVRRWWAYVQSGAQEPAGGPGGYSPTTELYLVEIGFLGVLGLLAVCLDRDASTGPWGRITWSIAGMLATLSVLGSWSIGPSVTPAAIALSVAALLAGSRKERGKLEQAAHFALGAFMQGFLMFVGTLSLEGNF